MSCGKSIAKPACLAVLFTLAVLVIPVTAAAFPQSLDISDPAQDVHYDALNGPNLG